MANLFVISIRLLKAINLLASSSGTTIKELMEGLNISRRSVFRLIQTLEEMGFPLVDEQSQPKAEKTYRLVDSYVLKLPNITIANPNLTVEEMIYILAVLKVCKQSKLLAETHIHNSAMEKMVAMLQTEAI